MSGHAGGEHRRWSDLTKNPNSPMALNYRRNALDAARARPVTDREQYLCSLSTGRRVLDVGVADHDWAAARDGFALHRRIAASSSESLGVDVLDEAVAALVAEGFGAVTADVCAPDFCERVGGPWDVIVAGEVIEHLGRPEAMMENFHRLLAPGGLLVLTTPNPHCLRLVTAYLRGCVVENADHLVYWFPSGISELADRLGFRLVRYRGVVSATTGKPLLRALSRLAARTILVPESACWTMIYELEPRVKAV